MNTDFHKNLAFSVGQNNVGGANRVIMNEMGKVAINHRADFIDLLRNTDVPAYAEMADAELLNLYFENICNKELLIGSAFLVNMHNKTTGFDGESEISDTGVKASYKVMSNFFGGPDSLAEVASRRFDWKHESLADREQKSGFIWDTIAKGAVGITGKVIEGQNKKKYGALDALTAKEAAKSQMAQAMIAQRQSQIDAATKAKDQKAKNLKIGLIVGGSVVVLGIAAFIYLKIRKK